MFQAAGPATEKTLSPKPVRVLGTSKEPDVEDLRVARPCSDDIGTRTSMMYSGLGLLTDELTMRQFVLHSESNWQQVQFSHCWCSGVTWSRASSLATKRTAAFMTRFKGASVIAGRPATTELQLSIRASTKAETSRCIVDFATA